jgi:hypothetical protein
MQMPFIDTRVISMALLCALVLGVSIAAAETVSEGDARAQRLFRVERSKNANVVVYDALMTQDGFLHSDNPVDAYWLALAEDGQRKKLSRIQRRFAYGFKTRFLDEDTVVMNMAADIDREITVDVVEGVPRAVTAIDGNDAVLDKIYVKSIEKKLWPSVEYLELFGVDAMTGEERYERIYP